jgi:hypothetical protein
MNFPGSNSLSAVSGARRTARLWGIVAAFHFLLMLSALGQAWQFDFDATGNLLIQTSEASALPQILGQPQQQVVVPGELASFFVVVADSSGLTYQWLFNGTNLSGATTDTLLLTNVSTNNQGQYSVVLVNDSGSITSAPAALLLDSRGCGLPDSWQLTYFGNLNQNTTGDYDGDGVSNLQEFLDGTNPNNHSSALYRLTILSGGGSVSVIPYLATYTNGQTVTLTASPANTFRAWTGDLLSPSNTVTLTMNSNQTVYANFGSLDLVWTNAAGGDWMAAANWSPNLVPGSNDNAFILLGPTVTLNTNTDCGSLTFGGSSVSPTLTGTGVLTLHGVSYWGGGSMSGSGRTVIAPGASLTIANVSAVSLSARVLENDGNILWNGAGGVQLSGGAVITNSPGALLDGQSAATLSYLTGGSCRFDNAGTFRKSFNAGTITFGNSVALNNYGEVDLQAGTLLLSGNFLNNGLLTLAAGTTNRLANGGSATGTFSAPAGAQVDFNGGSFTLNPGAQLNGNGLYQVTSAILTCNTNVTVQNLNLASTLAGTDTVTIGSAMNWTGGGMSGTGRTVIAPGATLNVTNSNSLSLTTRPLENGGTVIWTGAGNVLLGSGAVITNDVGASFQAQGSFAFGFVPGAACRFDNAGTFRKSSNKGTTTFNSGVLLNNYGIVDTEAGTLLCNDSFLNNGLLTLAAGTTNRLANGGSATGTFSAPAGAQVDFNSGTFTLGPGAQLNGNGLYQVTSAILTCNTNVSVQNLNLAGVLAGTDTVTIGGVMNWTGGGMSGSGRTVIAPGATLNLANASSVSLTTRPLENGGTVVWTGAGGAFLGGGVLITNRAGALFDAQSAAAFSYVSGAAPRFDNAGTFHKSLNTGATTFGSLVTFNNFGTVDLETGILSAGGGYTCTANSTLTCALGGTTAGTGYGQLQAAGTVTLNGTLNVNLTNGFLPATNNSFTVLTAGTRSGTFANFIYPSNAVTMQLSNTTSSVIVRVTGVAPPRPVLLAPTLAGSNVLLTWTAVSNITYRLEFNPDLVPSDWNALPGDVLGASNTASKLDTLTPSNRFYRVQVLP